MGGTQITDEGIKEVAKLQNLKQCFGLYDTQITDAGLKDMARLQNLEVLYLEGTEITDRASKN